MVTRTKIRVETEALDRAFFARSDYDIRIIPLSWAVADAADSLTFSLNPTIDDV